MKDGKHVNEHGDQYWYQNGKLHRTGGPAQTWADGSEFWYQNGKLHRDDGPAYTYADGSKSWYQNGNKLSYQEILIKKDSIEFDEMIRELCTAQ